MEETILALSIEELGTLFVSAIPAGFLIGCIPMVIGFAVRVLVKIFNMV